MKIVIKHPTRQDELRYEDAKERFFQLRQDTLYTVPMIHRGNAEDIAERLREREIELAYELLDGLSKVRPGPRPLDFPLCQSGETCVPSSVANGLLRLGQETAYFGQGRLDQAAAINHFIDDFLLKEPGHDRGERRSLDRVYHYFTNERHRELGLAGRYRFRLTGSLIDMVYRLYSQDSSLLVVAKAHCLMAYGVYQDSRKEAFVELKDPLVVGSKQVELGDFARRFVWSSLGGLPYAVSLGESYSPAAALDLLEAQAELNHKGVCCSSGILTRLA